MVSVRKVPVSVKKSGRPKVAVETYDISRWTRKLDRQIRLLESRQKIASRF